MPVTIEEYAKITDEAGKSHEGKVIATNLTAIEEDGTTVYGATLQVTKVLVTVECDNEKCENSTVGDDFVTRPKTIKYDQTQPSEDYIKDIANVQIITDYKGERKVYCSADCYAANLKRKSRERFETVTEAHGKGPREVIV